MGGSRNRGREGLPVGEAISERTSIDFDTLIVYLYVFQSALQPLLPLPSSLFFGRMGHSSGAQVLLIHSSL